MEPSVFGHYVSAGAGRAFVYPNLNGPTLMASYSFAYKSHLLTVTEAFSFSANGEPRYDDLTYSENYFGILLGESLRLKWFMLSGSIGVGFTNIDIEKLTGYSYTNQWATILNKRGLVSMPLEFKAFHTSPISNIGVGIHIIENVLSVSNNTPSRYNSFYFGICIVSGFWNKVKTK